MKSYYIDRGKSDSTEYSIEIFGWGDIISELGETNEYPFFFECEYYLKEMIIREIGMPPGGCKFESEQTEIDYDESGSRVYYKLNFKYNQKRKAHYEYLHAIKKLLNSKRWDKKCERNFEKEYLKFIEFIKANPEEDYQFTNNKEIL